MKTDGFPGEPSEVLARRWRKFGLLHIPYRLLVLGRMLDRRTARTVFDNEQVTLAEWRVLAMLALTNESTINALAADLLVDPAEVSRACATLTKKGLAQRHDHPVNKSRKLVSLTSSGRDAAERIGRERRQFYGYLLEDLDEADRRRFDDFLLHIAIKLEQLGADKEGPVDPAG